ncbi:hypothetical protein FOA52_008947 [Chlamydomonas sp. UWO 241]|nr:hypothetical protein FOA52_008947 [Chlamydomonas sp. UWO 241]
MSLHVGVLHYSPSLEPFPLLADPASYEPNTLDISLDKDGSFGWWLKLLDDQVPTVVEKAIASEGGGELATRRAMAFGRSLSAHLHKLAGEPGAYGRLGLAELFEMREECLREFGFNDVYRLDKERENTAALSVLPDLLVELDAMPPAERLLCLIEGCLASNIFDWGAKECVKLYQDGTILDIYRTARQNLGKRPWAIDHFDALAGRLLPGGVRAAGGAGAAGGGGEGAAAAAGSAGVGAPPGAPGGGDGAVVPPAVPGGGGTVMGVAPPPYRRVMMFVDNAGADIVLGMLPLARELLRQGSEVVLVANSQPAINDITAPELRALLSAAARHCSILRTARAAGVKVENAFGGRVPAHPAAAAAGRHSWTSATTSSSNTATCGSNNATTGSNNAHPPAAAVAAAAAAEPARAAPTQAGPSAGPGPGAAAAEAAPAPAAGPSTSGGGGGGSSSGPAGSQQGVHRHAPSWGAYDPRGGGSASASGGAYPPGAKLFVVASGAGGPCMDFRRVPDVLAEACVGTDLLIIEGMGRAIHTNLYTRFRCDTLKLAMIKTEWLAKRLFGGSLYDCVCVFEEGIPDGPGAARPRTSEA